MDNTEKTTKRQLSCPECGEPMFISAWTDDEQPRWVCSCCGGRFWPSVKNPYAGLAEVIGAEQHRGDRKGGSNNKSRFGNRKKPKRPDSVRLHY